MSNFKLITTILLLFLILVKSPLAQSGGLIKGKITDASNNEELIGANILLLNTTIGASTDMEGNFLIRNIPAGTYSIRVSYISYQTIVINDFIVGEGDSKTLNLSLQPASTQLGEVVVTADAIKNSEANMLKVQKNSLGIVDAISAELISKNNSSDGADILRRMSGITISEGKFAYIRGVGDRYNNTLLNGATVSSTEPEKKSFSYDMLSASLIENIVTAKTFTPDQPAEFTGGLVQIKTVEFPERFFIDASTSTSYSENTNLASYTSYQGGSRDWLGLDDGTRSIPSIIGSVPVVAGNYPENTNAKLQEIGRSFANNWKTSSSQAPLNGGLKLAFGDRYYFNSSTVGYIGSLTYSNNYDTREIERNLYDFEGPRILKSGANSTNNVTWGGLFNLSMKIDESNKLSFKNMYNQNTDNEITELEGQDFYSTQMRKTTSMRFISRSLYSTQLSGMHHLAMLGNTKINWIADFSQAFRDEPDARIFAYQKDALEPDEPYRFLLDQSITYRFFSELKDNSVGFKMDFHNSPFELPQLPSFKFGFAFENKSRDFDARFFGFKNKPGGNFMLEDSVLQQGVDVVFNPENINPNFIEVIEITKPSDNYDSKQKLFAGFLMGDASISENLKVIAGLRYEFSNQTLTSASSTGTPVNVDSEYRDILPSLAITWIFNPEINFRFAYSRTLARPEFRELAPFTYYDFVSSESVQGNPELKRSLIQNLDFRFEYFLSGNELIAFSLYSKKFDNPIEQVLIAASQFNPIRSYANAKTAENYGAELEIRKNLSFFSDFFQNFSFVGNLSLIQSNVQLDEAFQSGFQVKSRPMQGQSDYVFNAGLYYDNPELSLSTSLIYNKVGEKIAKAGFSGLGDVIEKPRDQIDFSVSKDVFDFLNVKFVARDILAQDHLFIQKSPLGDKTFSRDLRSNTYSVTLSYKY
ncbi:MAG: TonB-dependent receptor [Ignavibacteriaceae bacterium]